MSVEARPSDGGRRIALWPAALVGAPGVVLAGLSMVTRGGGLSPAILAATFGAIGIAMAARRRFLPDLRTEWEGAQGKGWRTGLPFGLAMVALALGTTAVVLASIAWSAGDASAVRGALASVSVLSVVLLAWLVRGERRAMRRAWRVAMAGPATLESAGAMDGRVIAGSVRRRRKHALHRDAWRGPDGRAHTHSGWSYEEELTTRELTIALEGGRTLHASVAGGGAFATDEPRVDGLELIETLEAGDRVRVVGRPDERGDAWWIGPSGDETLLVFGSRARSARAALLRALVLHGLARLALATIAIGAAALAALG